jgi:hypothetical protein
MGCNCGGTKTANLTYVYTNAQGRTTVYRTEIEAKAAVLRNGGSYTTAASAR